MSVTGVVQSKYSAWREILEYFNSAIQIGMTATPKETEYAPYKVIRIDIDRDIEGWIPPPGMVDDLGDEIEQREYNQKDMDRILILNQRTKL